MTHLLRTLAISLPLVAACAAQAAGTIQLTPASSWGTSDGLLGLKPTAVIEDFEDTTLAAGLAVTSSNGLGGGYGPVAVLPRTFDPRPTGLGGDDAFGSAFYSHPCGSSACTSVWDGSKVLLNTSNNNSMHYGSAPWSDITFTFAAGVTQVGFSLQQNDSPINVYVNGAFFGTLPAAGGGGRNGYYRFDITPSTGPGDAWTSPIYTMTLDGSAGDAWTIDHLAFAAAVPEPANLSLWAAGLLAVAARRQRARTQR